MINERFKFGACIWSLPETGPEACSIASRLGLEGLELDMGMWEDNLPLSGKALQKKFLEAGNSNNIEFMTLGVNALCFYGMSQPEKRDTVKRILSASVETALAMNIPKLQLPSFLHGIISNERGLESTIESLRFVCELVEGTELLIGTENALSVSDNFRIAEEVGSSNLRFYFDTSNPHWFGDGMDPVGMIAQMADLICEHHVKDEDGASPEERYFVPLGKGQSSFLRSVDAIIKSGYQGWLVLENDYSETLNLDDLKNDLELLKSITGSSAV